MFLGVWMHVLNVTLGPKCLGWWMLPRDKAPLGNSWVSEDFLETSKPQTSSQYRPQPSMPSLAGLRHGFLPGWWGGKAWALEWAALDLNSCSITYCLDDPGLIIGLAKKFVRLVNTLFSKVLHENEKCVFYFYLKPNELFGRPYT